MRRPALVRTGDAGSGDPQRRLRRVRPVDQQQLRPDRRPREPAATDVAGRHRSPARREAPRPPSAAGSSSAKSPAMIRVARRGSQVAPSERDHVVTASPRARSRRRRPSAGRAMRRRTVRRSAARRRRAGGRPDAWSISCSRSRFSCSNSSAANAGVGTASAISPSASREMRSSAPTAGPRSRRGTPARRDRRRTARARRRTPPRRDPPHPCVRQRPTSPATPSSSRGSTVSGTSKSSVARDDVLARAVVAQAPGAVGEPALGVRRERQPLRRRHHRRRRDRRHDAAPSPTSTHRGQPAPPDPRDDPGLRVQRGHAARSAAASRTSSAVMRCAAAEVVR